jgi:hypothetical protein
MKPSGCIYNQNVGVSGFGGFQRVEQNRRRVSSLFLLNQWHARALRPNFQLLGSGGAKRISRAD